MSDGAASGPTLQSKVEGATSLAERPLRRITNSARANILPHAGTISVFLFGIVVLTGVYITLFYEYGFDASYQAVADLDGHPIQRVMRAIHRYASAALVLTTLVHAWRVFVAARFTAARRFRWATGIAALTLVWLAGVTGYWLVWDVRAQAIGEATARLIGGTGAGAAVVAGFIGSGSGSGSGLMVFVWFLHLALTAVIGYFLWRHLRRSQLPWIPPRHWMGLMALALLIIAIALPVGMLDPADPGRLTPTMPIDPFMLFLLPPLLSLPATAVAAVAVALLAAAVAVPWALKSARSDVVSIDAEKCTGCELCVLDCPYAALDMVEREHASPRAVAEVDADACVGCGICVGSCSFGAIELPGFASPESVEAEGRHVVVACKRHLSQGIDVDETAALLEVNCTGEFHAQAVGDLVQRGALSVQMIGCAPGECVYGIGNELAHDRLSGDRAPHVARKYAGLMSEDFVALGDADAAIESPGGHPTADHAAVPESSRSRVAAGVVVLVSVVAVGIATMLPYGGQEDSSSVRVVVNHVPGSRLIGQDQPSGEADKATRVTVEIDGQRSADESVPVWGGRAVGVVDVDVDPGDAELTVTLLEGGTATVLHDGPATFSEGRRFVVEARDAPPPPGVAEGERVFGDSGLGACAVCHSTEADDDGVGPSLAGVGDRAANRVPGLSAEEYLTQSILDPDAFIVPGYRAGQMLPIYNERLTDTQLESLVEYLASLEEDGG